jgi:hypothetical protein
MQITTIIIQLNLIIYVNDFMPNDGSFIDDDGERVTLRRKKQNFVHTVMPKLRHIAVAVALV